MLYLGKSRGNGNFHRDSIQHDTPLSFPHIVPVQCVQVLERTRGHLEELAVEEGEMRGREVFKANMLQHMAGREGEDEEEEGLGRDRGVIRTNLLNNISDREGQDGGEDMPSGEQGLKL